MLARVTTFAIDGLEPRPVTVEVDLRSGLPAFTIVGLADRAVREARERVRAALLNSGFEFPLRRITVNLAPAHLRKAGPGFDLAIACAILAASGQLPADALARWRSSASCRSAGRCVRAAARSRSPRVRARAGLAGLVVPRERARRGRARRRASRSLGVERLRELAAGPARAT